MSYAKIEAPGDYGDKFSAADHVDSLLEIECFRVQEMSTQMGPARAAVVNVKDFTQGTEYIDQLVFPSVLVKTLAGVVGQKVLAYLRLGIATPGKNAPFLLIDASEDPDALRIAGAAPPPKADPAPEAAAPGTVDEAVAALGGLLK